MKNSRHNSGVRMAAALSLGLAFAGGLAYGETFTLAAGASTNLTSETAETTTYDSMSITGSLTVSGYRTVTVPSTGAISVPGGTVTVSGANAQLGTGQSSSGTDWTLGFDADSGDYGKVVIDGGKLDAAVGAKTFTIANGGNGVGGSIDFMEINGGGFKPYTLRNQSGLTARIKASGTSRLAKPGSFSGGRGIFYEGPFEILLVDGAQLTIDFAKQKGSLNGGTGSSENSVDFVGAGDVIFKMEDNGTACSLRTGAKLNPAGSVTFGSSHGTNPARFSLEGDDLFGPNVTNVCVAATGGSVTLDIAAGTTQTVRRLSFLRAGKDDVLTGAGTLRFNAVDSDAVFEARLADDAALTIEKTGAQPVTAPCITNYPALKVLAGSYTITNDCAIGALTLAEGATLVIDGAAVHADAFDNAGGAVSYRNGGTLDFRRTVAAGETEEVRNWTMNGGTGFVKDGAGTLHLYDPAVTGMVHVAQGTLSFSRHGLLDTYYHIIFKEQKAYSSQTFGNFNLRRWFWYAPNAATFILSARGGSDYSSAGEGSTPAELAPGGVTCRKNRDPFVVRYRTATSGDYSYVTNDYRYIHWNFNGDGKNGYLCYYDSCSLTNAADEASWLHLWVRLPNKPKFADGVDGFNSQVDFVGGNLTAWTVESSATGADGTWTTVSDVSGYVPAKKYDGPANDDIGKPQAYFSYTQQGVRNLADTLAVQVDSGATLDFTAKTGGQTIDRIVYDVSKGGGTLKNVAVAASGVLEIIDAGGALDVGQPLPLVFDGVTGTENFKNWTVTVNGAAVERELVFRGGALAFGNPATVISFR